MKKVSLLFILILMTNMLFADPFGLKMGMTLEEIKAKCSGKEPKYSGLGHFYVIEPMKKDDIFSRCEVGVHSTLGLFVITARTDAKTQEDFESAVSFIALALKAYYGDWSETEANSLKWYASKCERLKKERLNEIFLEIIRRNRAIFLVYKFENFDKANEFSDSPF